MGDFLSFRKMITPTVIQFAFWLGVLGFLIAAVGVYQGTNTLAAASPLPPAISAILVLVIGSLIVRIYCELLMVLFRIYESLRAIELNKAQGRSGPIV